VVLECEFRASGLLGRHSITWVIFPALFSPVIFEIGSAVCLGWPALQFSYFILPPPNPGHWDDRWGSPYPAFSIEMGSHELFLPGLAWNCNLPDLSLLHSLVWQACTTLTRDKVWWTPCLDWPQAVIIPISASQVTRIAGIIYQHLATTMSWLRTLRELMHVQD
jgi:hypothetical protein